MALERACLLAVDTLAMLLLEWHEKVAVITCTNHILTLLISTVDTNAIPRSAMPLGHGH